MARSPSKMPAWLKKGISIAGVLVFLAGLHWLWQLQAIWPRATTDAVPHPILEALGVIVGGLYMVSRSR